MSSLKILILGGIGEAKHIARHCIKQRHSVIYSIAGLVRHPDLDCTVRIGGFSTEQISGTEGLAQFISQNRINIVIDATHPYASGITKNAAEAALRQRIPCWRYLRPGWTTNDIGDAVIGRSLAEICDLISGHSRPFFTVGQSILELSDKRQSHQHWIVRTAMQQPDSEGITIISTIGPFRYEDDMTLMEAHNIDALITKNSGGKAVSGKIRAARKLNLPIYLLARPAAQDNAGAVYDSVESLLLALDKLHGHPESVIRTTGK